jgi:two-component sensor histidine kinase
VSEPLRVLYVDDDFGLGRLLKRALSLKGMSLEHTVDPDAAVDLVAHGDFHIVALDHDLGSTTGLDVLARIRALPEAPPVIYVTGSDDIRVAVAALKAGAVDYVWKDVEGHYRDLLVESIASALAQETLKRDKQRSDEEVRKAKERAELLLSEVNHRVANSLALVAALARLQANAVSDQGAKAALQEVQARIAAIAGIHRRLYTSSDVRFVEMDAYVASLVADLSAAMSAEAKEHRIELEVKAGLSIATDKAVSIGVLITELVTNAYKCAYPGRTVGDIRVKLNRLDNERIRLAVEDDGIGWDGTGAAQGTGVGSRVIKAMASNLKATLTYDTTRSGTRAVMEFAA